MEPNKLTQVIAAFFLLTFLVGYGMSLFHWWIVPAWKKFVHTVTFGLWGTDSFFYTTLERKKREPGQSFLIHFILLILFGGTYLYCEDSNQLTYMTWGVFLCIGLMGFILGVTCGLWRDKGALVNKIFAEKTYLMLILFYFGWLGSTLLGRYEVPPVYETGAVVVIIPLLAITAGLKLHNKAHSILRLLIVLTIAMASTLFFVEGEPLKILGMVLFLFGVNELASRLIGKWLEEKQKHPTQIAG